MTRSEEQRRDFLELDAQKAAYCLTLDLIGTLDRRDLGAIGRATALRELLAHVIHRDGAEPARGIVNEVP